MAWFGKSAKSLVSSGHVYANKLQLDRAVADFDEAIRLDPQYSDAFIGRAHAYALKGLLPGGGIAEYDRVIADFDEAIRLNPKDAGAFYARGKFYKTNGQRDRAIADFDEANTLDPNLVIGLLNLGERHLDKGQYDFAIADADEAILINPKLGAAFCLRSGAYAAKSQFDLAITDCNEWIRLDPKNARAFHGRGCIYGMKGEDDRAIADFDEALRLDPDFTEAINIRAEAMTRKKELAATMPASPTNLITPKDEQNYGNDLIDVAKRDAKEAMAPETSALRQNLLLRSAAVEANNAREVDPEQVLLAEINAIDTPMPVDETQSIRFRVPHRELTEDELAIIEGVKDQAEVLEAIYRMVKPGRYHSLALAALEESIMWITKEITG